MKKKHLFDLSLHDIYQKRAFGQKKEAQDFLLQYNTKECLERFSLIKKEFQHGIDYFGYTGLWGKSLQERGYVKKITQIHNDFNFHCKNFSFYECKRENLPQKFIPDFGVNTKEIDLFLCPLMLHFVNDLQNLLKKIKNFLQKDGLFFACLPGAGTFSELRAAMFYAEEEIYKRVNIRVSPFLNIKDAGNLLQYAGFALPVIDRQDLTLRYDNIYDLMRDIRLMGMQNILFTRSQEPVSRRFFDLANQYYKKYFSDQDGRLSATISLLWLSGWSPDETQQKPLKPGSAKIALQDYFQSLKS